MSDRADDRRAPGPWLATITGLAATLVGIGLARFAYTPLIPPLIEARWFAPADVVYLGAANLAGYLAGALLARPLAARLPARAVVRAMMLVATLTFFACAAPLSFPWFFAWRFASGVAGGTLMVLGASLVLARVPPARRGLAGGVIFTGVGLGIAASGTLVPALLERGLAATWIGLGLIALFLTAATWRGWPRERAEPAPRDESPLAKPSGRRLTALYVSYGLNAVGLVPHMVFLVDFIARGLDQGLLAGARYWVLFGIGAMVGPVAAGTLADRIGFRAALRLAYVVQAAAVGLLIWAHGPVALVVSSLVVGACVPGIVPLTLGRVHELVPRDPKAQRAAWGLATTAFALGQAAAAYGLSLVFDLSGSYAVLYAAGAAAFLVALALDLAAQTRR